MTNIPKRTILGALLVLPVVVPSAWGDEATIVRKLEQAASHLTVAGISASPVAGMHEVEIEEDGARLYVTADGEYLFAGDVYAVAPDGLVNLTEARREGQRRETLARIDAADTIAFAPTGEAHAVLYAFTDVSCYFCRLLHQDMDKLNDLGIEVRYLAYPRAGQGTETFDTMVSVWCARHRQQAITAAKSDDAVAEAACESPVAEHLALGRAFHIGGTPTMFTEAGKQISGYVSPEDLVQRLGL